ncbi:hypothetical protein C8R47DRAFT_1202431 [Mycena vitilis]|nr:hypothetical protein C8R47DRAFT_1202431 [Mycena vitilis]
MEVNPEGKQRASFLFESDALFCNIATRKNHDAYDRGPEAGVQRPLRPRRRTPRPNSKFRTTTHPSREKYISTAALLPSSLGVRSGFSGGAVAKRECGNWSAVADRVELEPCTAEAPARSFLRTRAPGIPEVRIHVVQRPTLKADKGFRKNPKLKKIQLEVVDFDPLRITNTMLLPEWKTQETDLASLRNVGDYASAASSVKCKNRS